MIKIIPILLIFIAATSTRADLLEKYESNFETLTNNQFNKPMQINSSESQNKVQGAIFAKIDYAYPIVVDQLSSLKAWCEILLYHLNVKACTYSEIDKTLSIYLGRKYYQKPKAGKVLRFHLKNLSTIENKLKLELTAENGPLGTSEYNISLVAQPYTEQETLVDFSFSYNFNYLMKSATNVYLNTIASGKVGFSYKNSNKTKFTGGVQGILERNTMRYFLAIETRLRSIKSNINYEDSYSLWFDSTETYHKQLYELSKAEYLNNKKKEYANSLLLQNTNH